MEIYSLMKLLLIIRKYFICSFEKEQESKSVGWDVKGLGKQLVVGESFPK